jgi:preprotein translocase subunit SecE
VIASPATDRCRLTIEWRKTVAKTAVAEKKREPNAVVRYFRETAAELRKVTWPTRQEARQLTTVVVIVVIITAIALGLVDYTFSRLIGWLISLG